MPLDPSRESGHRASRSTTPALRIAAAGFLVLVLLHLDFWRPQSARLLLGWMPEELAYRIAYIVLAWIYILWICHRVWQEEDAG